MALFQEAIVKKYIKQLDEENVDKAFSEFKSIYSESNIKIYKKIKEEAHQGEFIEDIFGKVLGYQRHVDIMREVKNETNAKKADAAILKEENVVGVIELKDNKTKNLTDVQQQAFNYKLNHKNCSYVITSNFHKLRFYIDDTTDYEEFDLYNLDKEKFRRFYLYLQREGLLEKNIPKLLRQETKFHEEEISKNLYKDYSNFKRSFFENALKNNPQFDKLSLFKKSQKFLDRVLFVLFAEDKGLVTTNSVVQIVEKWQALRDDAFDTPRPLYTLVLLFFNNLYLGKKDNKGTVLIPEFGGELFAPDEVLDQLTIDDDVLKDDLLKLSKYDFNTDVDVNILGHIFEHSLNEVDDVEAELRGEQLDKTKSKRKKDGVFYTPKYITKYIVDNTLGKLCSEKKDELKLDQDIAIFDYQKTDGKLNEKGKDLFERLNTYKSWLLTVKVCDPACGSGAFLNQALSFFIEEHKFVDDLIAELTNSPLRLFDTDLQILENNIYGVDINEESVEIAKLSMWLRTAQPGRKLSNLSNNIKCGNSLIDDPEVAGDKAFSWEKEFPTVFEKGGFDVVIGNPPYGASVTTQEINSFKNKYNHINAKSNDTYLYFTFKMIELTKRFGYVGEIIPNTWMLINSAKEIRQNLLSYEIKEIIDYGDGVFDDATVESMTLILKNNFSKDKVSVSRKKGPILIHNALIDKLIWQEGEDFRILIDLNDNIVNLLGKLKKYSKFDSLAEIIWGIKPYQVGHGDPKQTKEILDNREYHSKIKINEEWKPLLVGSNVNRYIKQINDIEFIKYGKNLMYPSNEVKILSEKILMRQTSDSLRAVIDKDCYYPQNSLFVITTKSKLVDLKYLLALLNSRFINYIYTINNPQKGKTFAEIKPSIVKNLPIKNVELINQLPFVNIVDRILQLNNDFLDSIFKITRYINSEYNISKPSSKLASWYTLGFSEFIKELNKGIKAGAGNPLTKKDEFEWLELFEENKKKALDIKTQIDQTDKEIDCMVYELYGLTEEEIQIVENS